MQLSLRISPIDSLFFRDARPFGPATQARSGLPTPQTLAGAIRTLLLNKLGVDWAAVSVGIRKHKSFQRCLEVLGSELAAVGEVKIRGPWFKKDDAIMLPVPANLRMKKDAGDGGTVIRLDPLRSPPHGWMPKENGMLPLWYYGRESLESLGQSKYVRLKGLKAFLEGGVPQPNDLVDHSELYTLDDRVGVGLNAATGTVATGLIYSAGLLSLKRSVSFYAEVSGPESALAPLMKKHVLMRFGGEGKCVTVQSSTTLADWPQIVPNSNQGRALLLATPALLNGWRPKGIGLISAAVGKSQAISGWDMARGGPKPNRFMVPAGSVYFLPVDAPVPHLLGSAEDSQIGWGHFLQGNWSYVG